jgi:large repetitive protein
VESVVSNKSSNVAGVTLSANASLVYSPNVVIDASTSVTVVEPDVALTIVSSKTAVGGNLNDSITYTLTMAHSGSTSYAYDLVLVDVVPNSLEILAATVEPSLGEVVVSSNTIYVFIDELPLGTVATLTYTTTIEPDVLSGDTIINQASLQYTSAPNTSLPFPGAARIKTDYVSSEVLVDGAVFSSFIVYNTSLSAKATNYNTSPYTYYLSVGEVVTFRLVTSIPDGTLDFYFLSQQLPLTTQQYSVLSATSILGSSITSSMQATNVVGNTVWYNFTNIANQLQGQNNNGSVVLEVQAVVGDVSENHYPSTITTYGFMTSALANSSRALTLSIVEATLSLSTHGSVSSPSYVEAGEVVTYTTVIEHTTSSTTAAYQVDLVDTLSPYVTLVVGSITTSFGTVVTGNNTNDSYVQVYAVNLPLGRSIFKLFLFLTSLCNVI